MSFDERLLDSALKALRMMNPQRKMRKRAFVPGGQAAGMQGMPQQDQASAAGGLSPDLLAALAGAMDMSGNAGAAGAGTQAVPAEQPAPQPPPPPPPPPAETISPDAIRNIIREELLHMQTAQNAGKGSKTKKVGPDQLHEELVRIRKLLLHLYNVLGVGLPTNILDDSDEEEEDAEEEEAAGPEVTSAIQPIEPISPAFPVPKTAAVVVRHRSIGDPAVNLLGLVRLFDMMR